MTRRWYWWQSLGRLFSSLSAGRPIYMPRDDFERFDSAVYVTAAKDAAERGTL
jgi:hypothetical protein